MFIAKICRTIPTIRKHIVPQEPLAGAGVAVRVEETLDDGIVISALEVIEARLYNGEVAMRSKNKAQKLQKHRKEDRCR